MQRGRRRTGLLLAASAIASASPAEAGETVAYTYDALGRLTATSTSGTVNNGVATGIVYDPAGNRSSYAVTGAAAGAPAPLANSPPATGNDSAAQTKCSTATSAGLANDPDPDVPLALRGATAEATLGVDVAGGTCGPLPASPPDSGEAGS